MTGEFFNHFRTAIRAKFKVPLQSFLAIWTLHVVASSYQKLWLFKAHLIEEMQIYDELLEYGKLKGWIVDPPAYRI